MLMMIMDRRVLSFRLQASLWRQAATVGKATAMETTRKLCVGTLRLERSSIGSDDDDDDNDAEGSRMFS